MLDLLVIGAGLAGFTAAYAAAKAGLRVRVVAKGMGITHWAAGTIDVLGYYPLDSAEPVQQPLESIRDLVEAHPDHPYALLDEGQRADALKTFTVLTGEIGLPYTGAQNAGSNLRLPSPVGVPRPAFLAPQAQLSGDLERPTPMLIVGFRGLRDFFPELIAANLQKLGYDARAESLPMDLITDRRDFNTIQLADELEEPARRSRLAAELKRLAEPGERIGLPAILGRDKHLAVLAELQTRADAKIFEIPTLPPSVPGIRLHSALRQRLGELGVRVEVGMEVIDFHAENGRIQWVATETSSRPLKHRAANFLLATGGILGGGFDSDHTGHVWESVFGLPLTTPQKRSEWFRPRFLDPAGQPVYQGGVSVNREFQPVNSDEGLVHENLWAAGGCLAHADPIHERSLGGIAVTTGMTAGRKVAETIA